MPRRAVEPPPHRGISLAVLIVNQLLAGVGVASGMALAAILVADLTGVVAMGGLAQSSSVLGAAIAAVPLARLAVRSGRHVALASGYAFAFLGAVLVIAAATSGWPVLVFVGLAAFGAGNAAGLQARFAATEIAAPGFAARSMSLVLWATTIGSVAGPLLSQTGDELGRALGLPPLVGPFIFSAVAFALSSILVGTLLRTPKAGYLATDAPTSEPVAAPVPAVGTPSGSGCLRARRARRVRLRSRLRDVADAGDADSPTPTRPVPRPSASALGRHSASRSAFPRRSSRSSRSCARTP